MACMKRLMLIPLIVGAVTLLLFTAFFWLPGVSAGIRNRSSIQRAYKLAIRPATDWVRSFHQQRGRLPTDIELDDYAKTNWSDYIVGIYDSPPKWQRSWGRLGVDFML